MTEEQRKDFARYVIETTIEDAIELLDVIELYDSWYTSGDDEEEIGEKDAREVLDLIHRAILDVYWPLV